MFRYLLMFSVPIYFSMINVKMTKHLSVHHTELLI